MSTIVGGLRARLIRESLYQMIHGSLATLGWFDPGRQHSPVAFNSTEVKNFNAIPLNTAALADASIDDNYDELGSLMTESKWRFYVDFFAENDSVGLHFSRDVKDILQGRMASAGRTRPNLEVFDLRQATPPSLFFCDIEDVIVDRPSSFAQDFQKFWYSVRFDLIDVYTDET